MNRWTPYMMTAVLLGTFASASLAQDEVWPPSRIKAEWVGKQVFSRGANGVLVDFWLREDGTAAVAANNFSDTGTWRLSDTGYCTTWRTLRSGEERCFTVRSVRGQVQVFNPDGSLNTSVIRVQ